MLGPGATNYPKLPPNLKGVKRTRTANTTSLGLECFDKLVEDGIPFPSMVLVDERKSRKYSRIMTRVFIAEGIKSEQRIVVAGAGKNMENEVLDFIPQETAASSSSTQSQTGHNAPRNPLADDSMKIAWRYNTAPQVGGQTSVKERFDLVKSMPRKDLEATGLVDYFNSSSLSELQSVLIEKLKNLAVDFAGTSPQATRICLPDLSSSLYDDFSPKMLLVVLIKLRAYLMTSTAVLLVTIDGNLLEKGVLENIYSLFDSVFVFHTDQNSTGPTGRLEIAKLPRCYGSAPFRRENCDFTYKDTRHTIELRKMHLDPDGASADEIKSSINEPLLPKLQKLGVLASEDDD